MNWLKKIFLSNITEIQESKVLKIYGSFLALAHLLTFYYWYLDSFKLGKVLSQTPAVCWTFYQSCDVIKPYLEPLTHPLFIIYGLIAIFAAIGFIKSQKITGAYSLLAVATLMKLFIYIHDYRFMGNFHYMHYFALLVFLLIPRKKIFSRLIIVGFYFGAGLIKFNLDWLDGHALLRETILPRPWLDYALVSVIYLELVISLFLMSRKNYVMLFAFVAFIGFHFYSWHIVGYFYPVIVMLMLTIFILERYVKDSPESPINDSRRSIIPGTVLILIYTLLQITPQLLYPNSAVDGRGRLLSLNMLDARTACENTVIIKTENKTVVKSINPLSKAIRIQCDPLVYIPTLKELCMAENNDPLPEIDFFLKSRKTTDANLVTLVDLKNICNKPIKISWLGEFTQ